MSRLFSRLLTLGLATVRLVQRRRPKSHGEVQRILVAHWLLLGDTLLLAPLLAKLSRDYPKAERYVLARPAVAALFAREPYGFRAIPYDPRDSRTFHRLRANGPFDIAYVVGDNRYAWLARAIGARWIVGFEGDHPRWKNWMLDELVSHSAEPCAWADMAATLTPGPPPQPYRPSQWLPPPAPRTDLAKGSYVILHVGASTSLKLWPAERWRLLAEWFVTMDLTPIWSAGSGEERLVDEIDPQQRFQRHCGSLTLPELWHVLSNARLLICPDTGIAHLGRIVGVPTIALFGPGSVFLYGKGEFWRDSAYVGLMASSKDVPCRNQRLLFRREIDWVQRCGRQVHECETPGACMAAIPLEQVKASAITLLNQPRTKHISS